MLQNARTFRIVVLKRFNKEWRKQAMRNDSNFAQV